MTACAAMSSLSDPIRRVGQVIAEGEPDPRVRAADAEHDQALRGVEAEQVRHHGQDPVGRADLDLAADSRARPGWLWLAGRRRGRGLVRPDRRAQRPGVARSAVMAARAG